MSRPLKITLMMDAGWVPADDPELLTPSTAQPLTERHVAVACRELGHAVRVLSVGHELAPVTAALAESPPDLVFNLVEQFANDRRLSANVAAVLELLDIPFTGSGSTGTGLCLDKGLSKQLLSLHKIRAPQFALFAPGRRLAVPRRMPFPLVVKPAFEEGSEGIANASIVRNAEELAERVRLLHERWNQVAIVEEYVAGREIYVSLLGNDRLTVLPPRELLFGAPNGGPVIATRRVKSDAAYRDKWKIEYVYAELAPSLAGRIARISKKIFRVLQLRDYARLDLRLTPAGQISILEVNANPDIGYGDEFAESAHKAGISYNALIDRIIRLALRRYGQS